jgi:hypothetical protein
MNDVDWKAEAEARLAWMACDEKRMQAMIPDGKAWEAVAYDEPCVLLALTDAVELTLRLDPDVPDAPWRLGCTAVEWDWEATTLEGVLAYIADALIMIADAEEDGLL